MDKIQLRDEYKKSLGQTVKALRNQQGFTVDQLAEKANYEYVSLRQIEDAKRLPSLPGLVDISTALGVTPTKLLAEFIDPNLLQEIEQIVLLVEKMDPEQRKRAKTILETLSE